MTKATDFKSGDQVEVVRKGLRTTGSQGEVVRSQRLYVLVKIPGVKGTLSFNPSSLKVVVNPQTPVKRVYKIGCKEIGQGIQQIFDTKEEALARLEKWSPQLGGRVCQLYVLDSEYKTEVATKLVKVN